MKYSPVSKISRRKQLLSSLTTVTNKSTFFSLQEKLDHSGVFLIRQMAVVTITSMFRILLGRSVASIVASQQPTLCSLWSHHSEIDTQVV